MKKYILPIVLFFQMALLFTEVPDWVISASFVFLFLSIIPWLKTLKLLKTLTGLTSVLVIVIVVREFNFILSNELIASLLIILTSIRLIEHRYDQEEKPPYFLFLLGLFLAVVKFVFQIDFIFGFYAFLATVFYLYQFYPETFKTNYPKQSFKILRSIIAYSIPATVILFLVFPQFKISGGRQRNYGLFSTIGTSGFSAELRPGSISELVNNDNIAFRAEFTDFTPVQSKLYWRGQVLDRPMGLMWRRSNPINHAVDKREDESHIYVPTYKIILEPHFKEQLFSLYETSEVDAPESLLYSEKNGTYSLPSILSDRLVYNGQIHVSQKQALEGDREYYVHLNRRGLKVDELVKKLTPKAELTSLQKVNAIAKYFSENGFEYRLTGQDLAVNSLDDFLFKTKVGFCEHYASAAALILRYWNVPSRVVVGYQGGEFNRAGGFWTVKQQDAHAWVEYLDEKNNWVLFDPVMAIAPDRIALGSTSVLNSSGSGQFLKQLGKRFEIFDQISNFLEVSNYRWTLFFIEYSSANLKREVTKFYDENEDVQIVTRLIFLLVCIFIIYKFSYKYIYGSEPLSERFYTELHKFFKDRLPQEPNESFSDWKSRIIKKFPDSQDALEQIFEIYLKNRYGAKADPKDFKKFKHLLLRLKSFSNFRIN